ncbi:MAG TPA: hypothetical protein VIJ14_08210 [Rhabdochlamydiaceae bacterium]
MRTLWLLLLPCFLWGQASYSFVFVHIGKALPSYLEIALEQARLFNEECPIVLIASGKALEGFHAKSNITLMAYESLPVTAQHEEFQKRTRHNDQALEGYRRYTSERFLYLYDYMAATGAKNVFHLENDVLLYVDLGELLPIFQKFYSGIAATFESSFKCVPGFVYISNQEVMQKLAGYFAALAHKALWDMQVLGLFWKDYPEEIACLPMIMESYLLENTPKSIKNRRFDRKMLHCSHISEFGSIFDGAAIGVFFDGLDSAKGNFPPGYLIKRLFDASLLTYRWEVDEKGRKVPYASYGNETYRINNLHIASKRLEKFTSGDF